MSDLNKDLGLDLDAQRTARAEITGTPHITIGGRQLDLPPELPIDVLEPITEVNADVAIVFRQLLDARQTGGADANEEMVGAVINMVISKPELPTELITAIKTMARRLFGDDNYDHLVAQRPSKEDLGAIAKYLVRRYGVGLGESSPSSDSSEGTGTTSKATSSTTTTSTSAASGRSRTKRAS